MLIEKKIKEFDEQLDKWLDSEEHGDSSCAAWNEGLYCCLDKFDKDNLYGANGRGFIKDFIREALKQQEKDHEEKLLEVEAHTRQEVIEEIEKFRLPLEHKEYNCNACDRRSEYNEAIDDILSSLSSKEGHIDWDKYEKMTEGENVDDKNIGIESLSSKEGACKSGCKRVVNGLCEDCEEPFEVKD